MNTIFHLLNSLSDPKTKAYLLSLSFSESGAWLGALPVPSLGTAWLGALPVPSLGTKLEKMSLRIALGIRLGVPIIVEHTCVCGDVFGIHGLSCRRSGGHILSILQ